MVADSSDMPKDPAETLALIMLKDLRFHLAFSVSSSGAFLSCDEDNGSYPTGRIPFNEDSFWNRGMRNLQNEEGGALVQLVREIDASLRKNIFNMPSHSKCAQLELDSKSKGSLWRRVLAVHRGNPDVPEEVADRVFQSYRDKLYPRGLG